MNKQEYRAKVVLLALQVDEAFAQWEAAHCNCGDYTEKRCHACHKWIKGEELLEEFKRLVTRGVEFE